MRVSVLPLSIAGLGVALCLSAPASATVTPLVPAPPASSITFTTQTGSFTDDYTFTLTSGAFLGATDAVIPLVNSTVTSAVLDLFSGTPTTGTLVSSVSLTGSPVLSGTLKDTLAPGAYYYEVSAVATGLNGNALAVSAIPELQTWAMLGLGFAALGFVGFARGKRERGVFVD
jgi:hypothetical protein